MASRLLVVALLVAVWSVAAAAVDADAAAINATEEARQVATEAVEAANTSGTTPATQDEPILRDFEDYTVTVAPGDLNDVLESNPLVIVAIYSPTCGACTTYMPEFETAAQQSALEDVKHNKPGASVYDVHNPVFVRVDGTADGAEELIKRFGVTGFPTVRVVVSGHVGDTKLEATARTAAEITRVARRYAHRLSMAATLTTEVDFEDLVLENTVKVERKTAVVAFFTPDDKTEADMTICRTALASATASLVDMAFLEFFISTSADLATFAGKQLGEDVTLPYYKQGIVDGRNVAPCGQDARLFIYRCNAESANASCSIIGATMHMPTSPQGILRALATHALPQLGRYDETSAVLYDLAWIHREQLQAVEPRHVAFADDTRHVRRTRPLFVFFTTVRTCKDNTGDAKRLRYFERTLHGVAARFPNVSFAVLEAYEYNTLYLRLGFNRSDARNDVVFGVLDRGAKYSSKYMDLDRYNATEVARFVYQFIGDEAPRFFFSAPGPAATLPSGLKRVTGATLDDELFLAGPAYAHVAATERHREDVVLLLATTPWCKYCDSLNAHMLTLMQRAEAARRDAASAKGPARNSGARGRYAEDDDVPAMFLETPDDVATADADSAALRQEKIDRLVPCPPDDRSDYCVERRRRERAATEEDSAGEDKHTRAMYRKLQLWVLNATENGMSLEHFMPTLTENRFPVLVALTRTAAIATVRGVRRYDATLGTPYLFDFATRKYGEAGPTPDDMAALALRSYRDHLDTYGQILL